MRALPTLGLSVPLFNEEAVVKGVVEELLQAARAAELPLTLALVDNGSTDGTAAGVAALRRAHGRVILPVSLSENRGYGAGILAGMDALEAQPGLELLGWTWGDGQVHPAVLPVLAAACRDGADLAKARRIVRQDGWNRLVVTTVYAAACRLRGFSTPDVNGCPKVWRRDAWARMPRDETWLLDPLCVAAAERAGLSVVDAPVVMRARRGGRSKVRLRTLGVFAQALLRMPPVTPPAGR